MRGTGGGGAMKPKNTQFVARTMRRSEGSPTAPEKPSQTETKCRRAASGAFPLKSAE